MSSKKKIQIKRLKGKDSIDLLFEKGTEKHAPALILKYITEAHSSFYFSGVAVPKRKIKKAVQRNRIKRLMREAIHKIDLDTLFSGSGMLLYVGTKTPELTHLTTAVQKLFEDVKANP